ncbi:MAG: threonine ammonia-lyase [Candidatus Dadabacteria bacterium]
MITLKEIEEAANRLKDVTYTTPLVYSYSLSEVSGANVFFKLENLQRTGSFKIRGAYNRLHKLSNTVKNVVAASAGNHAQGVALAGRLLGMKATIVMPEVTPINKILATKHYGAEIVLYGATFDDAYRYAKQIEKEYEAVFIHPFDDSDIIAGQGTIGLEVIDSLPGMEAVFVPIGGGGLISGISVALKEKNPRIKIMGVQAEGAASMVLSKEKGKIVEISSAQTIADGIAIKRCGTIPFEIVDRYVDEALTVNDSEIEDALLILTERMRIVVEGAGAVGFAGLLKRKEGFYKKNVVIIISGGNIDINTLSRIIERGLVKRGRFIRLEIEIPDIPGSLGKLASLLGMAKANIVQIYHDRSSTTLPIGRAIVELSLETKGYEHKEEILKLLRENGYKPKEKE